MERPKQRNDYQIDRRRNERCRQFLLLEMCKRIILDVKPRRREFAVDNSIEYLRLRLAHKQRVNHRLPLILRRYWWWCIWVHNLPIKNQSHKYRNMREEMQIFFWGDGEKFSRNIAVKKHQNRKSHTTFVKIFAKVV